jgi:heme/copper-type cytochrome/quinol oxidase subunit 3
MLIFVFTELMVFAAFISSFSIIRASALAWPPPGQPRLPLEETAINTAALLASGVVLAYAHRVFQRDRKRAKTPLLIAILLGGFFVLFQGLEWVALVGQGLTLTSSILGSFFYLIIGLHALHAIAALGVLIYAWQQLQRGWLSSGPLYVGEIFWYFVVLVWPFIYLRVYA